MPGIVGFFLKNQEIDKTLLLEDMIFSVCHRSDYKIFKYDEKQSPFGAALVALDAFNLGKQPAISSSKKCILFFDGELYNNYTSFSDAEYILDLYERKENLSFLIDLEGVFSFVLYDKLNNKLYLSSDKFGLKPLYYIRLSNGLLFASEVKALLRYPNISRKLDLEALAYLFHFGFALGNNTLFKDIKLLQSASILTYNLKNNNLNIKQYWDLVSLFTYKGEYKKVTDEEIIYLFLDAVKKRLKNKEKLGISLSGGLDSRSILAALGKEAKDMPSYTLGLKGCQDERFSAQMAQIAGTKHVFLPITEEDLKDFISLARTLVFYSDGFYLPHELTEIIALNYFKKAPFKLLFRGHGGEIVKASLTYPVPANRQVFKIKDISILIDFVANFGNLNKILKKNFFMSQSFLSIDIVKSYLEKYFQEIFDILHPADVILYFFIFEYIRRQAVASLSIFRTQIEVRLPFMDEKFLSKVLELPVEKRYAGEIQYKIIKHAMPALIKVPNSNTGAPLDAGKLRLWFTDKLNSLLKKLSLPGFRHYTAFEKWQRKYFRKAIAQILFDKKTIDRGLYNPKALKNVFEQHVSGRRNYAHLLGTIVGLELYFRDFVD